MAADAGRATRWFTRVMWVGIAANLGLALPTLFAPQRMLAFSRLPQAEPLLWVRFAALLLILLSAFYVPAALNPHRYRPVAWLAVGARLAGVIFFVFLQPAEYRTLGYFDLVFFIPEFALLVALTRRGGPARVLEPATAEWRAR
ncbi:MAG TPA: hypothetical protein VM032_13685 [Vicinamibacterales bacterium]|nr:hypothetical protein [Vicinamibacterales bacterium]